MESLCRFGGAQHLRRQTQATETTGDRNEEPPLVCNAKIVSADAQGIAG